MAAMKYYGPGDMRMNAPTSSTQLETQDAATLIVFDGKPYHSPNWYQSGQPGLLPQLSPPDNQPPSTVTSGSSLMSQTISRGTYAQFSQQSQFFLRKSTCFRTFTRFTDCLNS